MFLLIEVCFLIHLMYSPYKIGVYMYVFFVLYIVLPRSFQGVRFVMMGWPLCSIRNGPERLECEVYNNT